MPGSKAIISFYHTHDIKNKTLLRAFIIAGFAVQRERIKGVAIFSKIAVGCFTLLT